MLKLMKRFIISGIKIAYFYANEIITQYRVFYLRVKTNKI